MKTMIKIGLVLVAAFSFSSLQAADIEAGKAKSSMCAGCHGKEGISSSGLYPHLAGQTIAYLSNQLQAFKDKKRENPMMQAMANSLSDDDIKNLAAFYASLENNAINRVEAKPAKNVASKAVMCQGCHGNQLEGRGPTPRLATQRPEYLITQLKAFKSKSRSGTTMQSIAANLSDEDIKDLAVYFGTLKLKQ